MFRVSSSDDGRIWHVLCDGDVVFSGTKQDVEDWLDRQENRPAHRPALNNPSRRRAGMRVAGLISGFFAAILARIRGR